MKRFAVALIIAGTFVGAGVPQASAGRLGQLVKESIRHPLSTPKLVKGAVKCKLKNHPGIFC